MIALDAVSGKEKWRFGPQLKQTAWQTMQHLTCRGVSYFDGSAVPAPAGAAPAASASVSMTDAERLAASVAEVTTRAAGVPQNVVTGQAKAGDPNPVVNHKINEPVIDAGPDCVERMFADVRRPPEDRLTLRFDHALTKCFAREL